MNLHILTLMAPLQITAKLIIQVTINLIIKATIKVIILVHPIILTLIVRIKTIVFMISMDHLPIAITNLLISL